jgi:hypothetical protein
MDGFYYWGKSQIECIELIKSNEMKVDGLELHFTFDEILNKEYLKYKKYSDEFIITIHIGTIDFGMNERKKFFENLLSAQKLLKSKYIIIHADEYSKLDVASIPKKINFIIENLDKNKKGFQKAEEIAKLNRKICFDINHLEEIKKGSSICEYQKIKDEVVEFHISSTRKDVNKKYLMKDVPHYLVYGSKFKIPFGFNTNCIWVIEGLYPTGKIELIKKEIELLRSYERENPKEI